MIWAKDFSLLSSIWRNSCFAIPRWMDTFTKTSSKLRFSETLLERSESLVGIGDLISSVRFLILWQRPSWKARVLWVNEAFSMFIKSGCASTCSSPVLSMQFRHFLQKFWLFVKFSVLALGSKCISSTRESPRNKAVVAKSTIAKIVFILAGGFLQW